MRCYDKDLVVTPPVKPFYHPMSRHKGNRNIGKRHKHHLRSHDKGKIVRSGNRTTRARDTVTDLLSWDRKRKEEHGNVKNLKIKGLSVTTHIILGFFWSVWRNKRNSTLLKQWLNNSSKFIIEILFLKLGLTGCIIKTHVPNDVKPHP